MFVFRKSYLVRCMSTYWLIALLPVAQDSGYVRAGMPMSLRVRADEVEPVAAVQTGECCLKSLRPPNVPRKAARKTDRPV